MEPTPASRLNAEQAAAIQQLLPVLRAKGVAALIGPAGSGKSFTLGHLLRQLQDEQRCVLLAAPTHKAAKVCRDFLERAGAQARACTVASLLRLRPSLDGDGRLVFRGRCIDAVADAIAADEPPDLIVVDEASMLSDFTCDDLWQLAQALGAALLLVGDAAQLPPVGEGRMARLFLDPPGGAAKLQTVHRNSGPVLALATAVRQADNLQEAWPVRSSATSSGSRVSFHQWPSSWLAAAAERICTPGWDADPDRARIVAWANRSAVTLGQRLREHRYGTAAARSWQIGEILLAPHGIQQEGVALGLPRAAACAEFRIVGLQSPQRLEQLLGAYPWRTPARRLSRLLEVAAGADVQRATIEQIDSGNRLQVWLELPIAEAEPWAVQCRGIRNAIRAHLWFDARREALAQVADLEAFVPVLRQAAALTVHSSQGSTFGEVFVCSDLGRCTGAEARALAYVAVSRASEAVHVLPMPGASTTPAAAGSPSAAAAA